MNEMGLYKCTGDMHVTPAFSILAQPENLPASNAAGVQSHCMSMPTKLLEVEDAVLHCTMYS